MPELLSVEIEAELQEYDNLYHLGEYSDEPGDPERTIDRGARGDMGRGELRYFVSHTADYAEENYERAERFARGSLTNYIVRAVGTVRVSGTTQTIETPGVAGVPSDADKAHADEVASEQLHVLREALDGLAVPHGDPLMAAWDDAPWSGAVTE